MYIIATYIHTCPIKFDLVYKIIRMKHIIAIAYSLLYEYNYETMCLGQA